MLRKEGKIQRQTKNFTETISTLAHLARFIIADLTEPSTRRRKTFRSSNGQRLALVGPLERLGHRPIVIGDKSQNFGLQVFDRGE